MELFDVAGRRIFVPMRRRKITVKSYPSGCMTEDLEDALRALGKLPGYEETEADSPEPCLQSGWLIAIVLKLVLLVMVPAMLLVGVNMTQHSYLAELTATDKAYHQLRDILGEVTREKLYTELFLMNKTTASGKDLEATELVTQYTRTTRAVMNATPWLPARCSGFSQFQSPKAFIDYLNQYRFDPTNYRIRGLMTAMVFYSEITEHLSDCLVTSHNRQRNELVLWDDIVFLKLEQAFLKLIMYDTYCDAITHDSPVYLSENPHLIEATLSYALEAIKLVTSVVSVFQVNADACQDVFLDANASLSSENNSSGLDCPEQEPDFGIHGGILEHLSTFMDHFDMEHLEKGYSDLPCAKNLTEKEEAKKVLEAVIHLVTDDLTTQAWTLEKYRPYVSGLGMATAGFSIFLTLPLFIFLKCQASIRLRALKQTGRVAEERYLTRKEILDELYHRTLPKSLVHTIQDYYWGNKVRGKMKEEEIYMEQEQVNPRAVSPFSKEGLSYLRDVCILNVSIPDMRAVFDRANTADFFNILSQLCSMLDERIQQYDVFVIDQSSFSLTVGAGSQCPNVTPCVMEMCNLALDLMSSCGDVEIPFTFDHKIRPKLGIHTGPCTGFVPRSGRLRTRIVGNTIPVAIEHRNAAFANSILVSARTASLLRPMALYELVVRDLQLEDSRLLHSSSYLTGRVDCSNDKLIGSRTAGEQRASLELITRPKYSFDSDIFYFPSGEY